MHSSFHSAKEQKKKYFTAKTIKRKFFKTKLFCLHINFKSFLVCCVKCSSMSPGTLNYYSKFYLCSIFLSFNQRQRLLPHYHKMFFIGSWLMAGIPLLELTVPFPFVTPKNIIKKSYKKQPQQHHPLGKTLQETLRKSQQKQKKFRGQKSSRFSLSSDKSSANFLEKNLLAISI